MALTAEESLRWWKDTGERELCQLLYWRWDPIGVSDTFPHTEGEHDDYTEMVLSALRDGATGREIARVLVEIEREYIDDRGIGEKELLEVGDAIAQWYANSQHVWKELRRP